MQTLLQKAQFVLPVLETWRRSALRETQQRCYGSSALWPDTHIDMCLAIVEESNLTFRDCEAEQ